MEGKIGGIILHANLLASPQVLAALESGLGREFSLFFSFAVGQPGKDTVFNGLEMDMGIAIFTYYPREGIVYMTWQDAPREKLAKLLSVLS